MSEPIYHDFHTYRTIARAALTSAVFDALQQWQQEDAVADAKRAHLEVHAGFIRDSELTPKQLAFRQAYQAFAQPAPVPVKLKNDATPVTLGSEAPKKKKS